MSYVCADGTTTFKPQGAVYNKLITAPTAPEKTNYTLDGWYTDTTYTTRWDFANDVVTGDMTLYSKWVPTEYTITFKDGATVVDTAIYTVENTAVTNPEIPIKDGYTGTWPSYTISTTNPTNFEVQVEWTANKYTVTFDSNGGSEVPAQTIVLNESATKPADPTKTGYTFDGWYTEDTYEILWNFDVDAVTKDMTLYSKWELINYDITYVLDSGINDESNPDSYTIESKTIIFAEPTRSSYTFDGWENENGDVVTEIITGSTGNVTLTALWSKNSSSSTYYEIEIGKSGYGTISPDSGSGNELSIKKYSSQTFTFTPDADYQVSDVLIDGISIGAVSSYTFSSVTSNHTLFVVFTPTDKHTNPQTGVDLNRDDHFAYIVGYPDETFGSNKNITRAEETVTFSRLLIKTMDTDTTYTSSFWDISEDNWFANAFGYMELLGITSGYKDGSFRGDNPITRTEFATIGSRFDELAQTDENIFSDVDDAHWAYYQIIESTNGHDYKKEDYEETWTKLN